MMKHEFEKLAGYEVTNEMYDKVIEPMYMSLEVSKQEFVKMLNKKYFALPTEKECLNRLKAVARKIYEACGHRTTHEEETELQELANEFAARFYNSEAYLNMKTPPWGCSFVQSIDIYSRLRNVDVATINLI